MAGWGRHINTLGGSPEPPEDTDNPDHTDSASDRPEDPPHALL